MALEIGKAYLLTGMVPDLWVAPHPTYGTPFELAAKYLGSLTGARTWHGFEVWVEEKDVGVIFMHDADLAALSVTEILPLSS